MLKTKHTQAMSSSDDSDSDDEKKPVGDQKQGKFWEGSSEVSGSSSRPSGTLARHRPIQSNCPPPRRC